MVATYLERDNLDKIIYINIDDQHPDSMRFLHDCERTLGKEIDITRSNYLAVNDVCRQFRYINGVSGARCSQVLKRRVREQWEYEHKNEAITYVWGFDLDEKHRADRIADRYPQFQHVFPLIEHNLKKSDCHAILANLGIKRPAMYDLGYQNNNCIGCVKGGMGYWNRIRKDFPKVFEQRAKMERDINASCLNGTFLDELDPERGIFEQDIPQDCGMFCYMIMAQ
jgi:hypothetical protein